MSLRVVVGMMVGGRPVPAITMPLDTLDRLLIVSDAATYADKQRRRSVEHR